MFRAIAVCLALLLGAAELRAQGCNGGAPAGAYGAGSYSYWAPPWSAPSAAPAWSAPGRAPYVTESYGAPAEYAPEQFYGTPAAPGPQYFAPPAAPGPQYFAPPAAPGPQYFAPPAAPGPQYFAPPAAPGPQFYGTRFVYRERNGLLGRRLRIEASGSRFAAGPR